MMSDESELTCVEQCMPSSYYHFVYLIALFSLVEANAGHSIWSMDTPRRGKEVLPPLGRKMV